MSNVRQDTKTPSPAQCLLKKCQENAASSAGITREALLAMDPGPQKRRIIDDITIIVLFAPN